MREKRRRKSNERITKQTYSERERENVRRVDALVYKNPLPLNDFTDDLTVCQSLMSFHEQTMIADHIKRFIGNWSKAWNWNGSCICFQLINNNSAFYQLNNGLKANVHLHRVYGHLCVNRVQNYWHCPMNSIKQRSEMINRKIGLHLELLLAAVLVCNFSLFSLDWW